MPYTLDNPPNWAKNKPSDVKKVAVEVFNSYISKGKSELEARIASQAAMKRAEDGTNVHKSFDQLLTPDRVESTKQNSVMKAVLGPSTLPSETDRSIVSAKFNSKNQLIIKFNTGETITTNPVEFGEVDTTHTTAFAGGFPSIPVLQGIILDKDNIPENNTEGMMTWNAVERTVDINLGGGVVLQGGQESHVNVANYTGTTLLNAHVVAFDGTDIEHDLPKAKYMIANGSIRPANIIGVTTEDIEDAGSHGRVTSFGKVRGIDTTGAPYGETWNEGDFLFAHPTIPGGLTNIEPTPPNVSIFVGIVLAKNATTGSIFIKPVLTSRVQYGSFSSTQTQTIPTINTAQAITCNSTEISSGISVVSNSRFTFSRAGLYRLSFSVQINKPSSGNDSMWIWLRKNGTDVPNSATRLFIQGNNSYAVASWDFIQNLSAGDYLELMFAVADTQIQLQVISASGFAPAAPSVLVQITQVNQ